MADKTIFELDVDNAEFLSKLAESKDSVASLGDSENLSGLMSGLMEAGAAIGALGVAAFAVKEAFDLVFNAEQIKAVNQQFELMSQNAGLSADKLKSGLVEAGGGMATDIELMQSANKALVQMGISAEKLPEVLSLARQVTAVFGGDLISNFEGINQAISTGNVRLLRHMGIIVDQKKAYDDFARSIGTSADMLSTQGKQQAMMNAILEKGSKEFKGVNLDVKEATNLWQQTKVAFKEVGEMAAYVFDTVFGKMVVNALKMTAQAARDLNGVLHVMFGTQKEKDEIRYKTLQTQMENQKKQVLMLEEKRRNEAKISESIIQTAYNTTKEKHLASIDSTIEEQKKKIEALKGQMEAIKPAGAERGPAGGAEVAGEAEKNNQIFIDESKVLEKRKEAHKEFEDELETLREQRVQRQQATSTTVEEVEAVHATRLESINSEYAEKLKALKETEKAAGVSKSQEAAEAEREIEAQKVQAIKALNDSLEADKINAMTREKQAAQSTAQGVEAAFKEGAMKARSDLNNFGKTGDTVFGSFRKNSKQALLDFGSGSKTAGEAAKEFMFGSIADTAEAKGEELMLSSMWPPNPLGMAAGAGLIALSGMLRSQSGGGSSGFGGIGAGGAGPGGTTTTPDMGPGAGAKPAASTTPAQTMTVNIQGSVWDTDATRTRMMEIMRQAQDMQAFQLNQIGPA